MEISDGTVFDGDESPVSVVRMSGLISSLFPHLNELQVVETYTSFLKSGLLFDLHTESKRMFLEGATVREMVKYVEVTVVDVISANQQAEKTEEVVKNEEVSAEPSDDWSLGSAEDEDQSVPDEDSGEQFSSDEYSDDWF